jgi:hypothetical protein
MSAHFRYDNVRLRFEHWPVIWLWPVSLVLMQVTLAEIGDFSVTVAVIVCHLLQLHLVMFYWLRRPPDWQTTMALAILGYGGVAGLFAQDPWEFLRSFALPEAADGSKVTADFKDGVLKVHLPKSEKAKPKTVEVKVA